MANYRVIFLQAARTLGWLIGAALGVGCVLVGTASLSNAAQSKFASNGDVKNKVLTGDGLLTLYDVTDMTCARSCMGQRDCSAFFYRQAERACGLVTSESCKNFSLTDAPGYQLYAGNTAASLDDMNLCPTGHDDPPSGCWKGEKNTTDLFHVSVGPAGVWAIEERGNVFYRAGTYGNPGETGTKWLSRQSDLNQLDVGTDVYWGSDQYGKLYYHVHNGISGDGMIATDFAEVEFTDQGFRWVSVSPEGSVWAVMTTGQLLHGRNAADGSLPLDQWDEVETTGVTGMERVDAGQAGVWALDSAGRLHYRLGTYGQDGGSSGTGGWRHVWGTQVFTSVSAGRDLVLAVDTAGHVWLRTCMGDDTPAGLGWKWLVGGVLHAEVYQSGDVTTVWVVSIQGKHAYITVLD